MNDDVKVLDAVYIKLRNNEPVSTTDFERFIMFIERAAFQIDTPTRDRAEALQSRLINVLQQKFMKGQ